MDRQGAIAGLRWTAGVAQAACLHESSNAIDGA